MSTTLPPGNYFDNFDPNSLTISGLNSNSLGITVPVFNEDVRSIQGKMFHVSYKLTALSGEMNLPARELQETVKDKLLLDLLYEMKKNNMISFTSKTDLDTGDITYNARIFAVPNDDVQYLRKRFDEK